MYIYYLYYIFYINKCNKCVYIYIYIYVHVYIYIYINICIFENTKRMYKEHYVCTISLLFESFFKCRLKTALEKQHKDADCVKGSQFLHI